MCSSDLVLLTQTERDEAEAPAAEARRLLELELPHGFLAEVPVFWHCKTSGVDCKGKIDALSIHDGVVTVCDLKTFGQPLSHDAIQRQAATLRYHGQAAWYIDAARAYCEQNFIAAHTFRFAFLWVESQPPHCTAWTFASDEFLARGALLAKQVRLLYRECMDDEKMWSLGPTIPSVLELPKWA